MSAKHKRHQRIFVRRRFAWDNPIDAKVVKMFYKIFLLLLNRQNNICSDFTKKHNINCKKQVLFSSKIYMRLCKSNWTFTYLSSLWWTHRFSVDKTYHCVYTAVSPNYLVHKFCGKTQFSHIVSGELVETIRKLCLSKKLPHQKIRWNYFLLRCVYHTHFNK